MALEELFAGYGGMEFPLPEIAGTYKGGLVICGDAKCVWDDLEAFGCADRTGRGRVGKEGHDFLTVNKLGETFPGRIEHWYSNEAKILEKYVHNRRPEYSKEFDSPQHTHSIQSGAKWRWPWGGHGTSGLGSVLVGLALGYDEIMLCGMPLDDGAHNGEPHWRTCRFASSEAAGPRDRPGTPNSHWERAINTAFDGKVKSMSGRTREWLGSRKPERQRNFSGPTVLCSR